MTDTPPIVAAEHVSKRFTGTQALDDVSFALTAGQVHGLIGENGAGKSTLIKILGGVHAPDTGTIRVNGTPTTLASPRDAMASRIVVIPQEMRIVPAQSVAENVLLGDVPMNRSLGFIPSVDRVAMRDRTAILLTRLNLDLDPNTPVGRLGYAERQLVMIARALSLDARVLILDEPTASLETREVERLFHVIDGLKKDGVAIAYVSHRLDEIETLADLCTVMRDGKVVNRSLRGQSSRDGMIRLMTGRDLEELHKPHDRVPGQALIQTKHGDAEIALHEREVVGLAGLLGSGTTDLLRGLFGAQPDTATLWLGGKETVIDTPSRAIGRGLGLVPGERAHGLIMALSVRDNMILPNLSRFSRVWRLDISAIDRLVDELMETVDIRPRDPDRPVRELSGGNQQKVIFARWLAGHASILLLDEPTHGIDVGAKAQIHRLMRRFAEDGGGIVFSSSEMVEVMSISDRVIAMRAGDVVANFTRDGAYTERAVRQALGG